MRPLKMLFLLSLLFTTALHADTYREGVHYTRLAGSAPETPAVHEVMEIFWFGCGHCYAFEPRLQDWLAGKAEAVNFKRSPVVWNETTRQHARLFHALEQLELDPAPAFAALHVQSRSLLRDAEIAAFVQEQGVELAAFERVWSSFTLDSEVRQAESRQRALGIAAVPALVVDGTWLVEMNAAVTSHAEVLAVVDYLLAKE